MYQGENDNNYNNYFKFEITFKIIVNSIITVFMHKKLEMIKHFY